MIFILLYTPCVAAMGAYVKEFGQKYARFIAVWTMGLAYGGATLYYQVTHFALHPMTSAVWIVVILAVCALVWKLLKNQGKKQAQMEMQTA
ncbi:ferrous iron transport protein B [Vibrio maritimus]|uniref:Ferrous iron transport protein B n=1 Tax=Vibrio maritimus TaxID=990268 RepID=A0A090S2G8_9VIBR|nr:ferrous iron transport protein B [Vibrio maritimus]